MKWRFLIPFLLCIIMTIGSAGAVWGGASFGSSAIYLFAASPDEKLQRMDETATALYTAAQGGNRQAAYAELHKLKRFIGNEMLHGFGRAEGWSALAREADYIEAALSGGAKGFQWVESTARVRLATDALARGGKGLWLPYEELLKEDLAKMKLAWMRQAGDPAEASHAHLSAMAMRVKRIELAAAMSGDAVRMVELSERVQYTAKLLESRRGSVHYAATDKEMAAAFGGIELAIKAVFPGDDKIATSPAIAPPASSSPLQWTLFLGTVISALLTWVGWRKYKQTPYGVKPLH